MPRERRPGPKSAKEIGLTLTCRVFVCVTCFSSVDPKSESTLGLPAELLRSQLGRPTTYEQALDCLYNIEILDVSRGCTFHYKMENNRLITVFLSNCFGRIHLAI